MGNKSDLPHYKLKQTLLYGKEIKPSELSKYGRDFLEAGWLSDAIEFYKKAGDTDGLEKLRAIAVEEGDVFLFRRVNQATEGSPGDQDWREIGDNATNLGKLQFAREAYRLAGDRKAMDKIDEMIDPRPDNHQDAAASGQTDEE